MGDAEILSKWYVKYRVALIVLGVLLLAGIIGIVLLVFGIKGVKEYHTTKEYKDKERKKMDEQKLKDWYSHV